MEFLGQRLNKEPRGERVTIEQQELQQSQWAFDIVVDTEGHQASMTLASTSRSRSATSIWTRSR